MILTVLAFAGLSAGAAVAEAENAFAIVGARIYASPDAALIENGVILMRGDRIAAVGPDSAVRVPRNARKLDVHGGTVVAGFWNSHVHLMTPGLLEATAKPKDALSASLRDMLTHWGFTTVFDIASPLANTEALRHRIQVGEVTGPKILTVGDPFFPEGGTPYYVQDFYRENHIPSSEVATPATAAARAARQLDTGADGVKLFTGAIVGGKIDVLPMRLDIAKAIVDEAHRRGKPAFSHPSNVEGLDIAIDSGVDILAHTTPPSGPWGPEVLRRMRAHDMALIPTLSLFADAGVNMDAPLQQVKAYSDAGGQILFGTDVGFTNAFDTTEEYRLMSRALTWRQILASLTTAPAKRFGWAAHKGRVAAGLDADLVVLDTDPATDSTAFAKVRNTIRAGRVIYVQ